MAAAGLRFAGVVALGVTACCAQTELSGPLASRNILILDAHEFGTSASAEIDQGLLSALHQAGVPNSRLYFEFLDLRRHLDPGYRDDLTALLRRKYESTKFDLIVAVAPPALSFVLDNRHDRQPLFQGAPVIGVAVPDDPVPSTREHPLILITDDFDVRGTLKAALHLLPGTKHILVVCGTSDYDRLAEFQAKPALREWADRLDISWLNNLPLDKMLRTVSDAPPHSLVLYLGVATDVSGHNYVPSEVAAAVSRASAAPAFGIADTLVRLGLVGGFVKDYTEEGREAGQAAVRILKGELVLWPAPPPIRTPNLPLFDWRQLKRWGLDESRLPKGSVVENRPPTIWSQHPLYVIGSVAFAGIESFLIVALWLQRRQRKLAQEKSRRDQALLRAVLDGTPDPIFLEDRECRMVMANPATLKALGKPAEKVLGKTSREYVDDPETGLALLENARQVLETGRAEPFEETLSGPGGIRTFLTTKSPYRDAEGRVVGIIGVARDITGRKRAEEALLESEEKHRRLFECMTQGVVYHASNGQVVSANQAAERILGLSLHELRTGSPVNPDWKLVREDGSPLPAQEHPLLVALRTGKPVEHFILGMSNPRTKAHLWLSITEVPVFRPGDTEPFQVYATFDDITEHKRAGEEKALLQAQLAQAQKMETVGRLAGGVAHDFNNLLTVINGYSKMLLGDLEPGDPLRNGLAEILKAGERAAGLTRQLLAFSRKQVLEPRRLDVNRVVEGMRPMLERLLGEDVEIRIALHAEDATIHADPHQLEQVVMNLVVNSRDAMPGVGKLLVETANVQRDESYARSHPDVPAGRYVMLAVTDTGVGMDEETKDRIFEPFFTTKGVGKGTGLGLSMVQGIVAQSGGYVEVSSVEGHGTTFRIYLPALTEEATDAGSPSALPALGGTETVLVVEDQAEVRNFTAAALKQYGYQVLPVENAEEALAACQRTRVDLVLTDVVMPHVSGPDLADRLELLRPGIKVLFMSGYTGSVIAHHGVLEDGSKFIRKPFTSEELAGKVRAVLGPPAPAHPGG